MDSIALKNRQKHIKDALEANIRLMGGDAISLKSDKMSTIKAAP